MLAARIRRLFAAPGRPHRARRPRLNPLEDRCVPAAFQFGSTGFDTATAVAADGAGNLYVAGTFNGTVDFDAGAATTNLSNAGDTSTADAYLAKYTAAGRLVWVGQLVDCTAEGLAVDAAGAAYLTGSFPGTTDFDLGAGVSNLATGSTIAAYVAKYNPDRTLAWADRFGGQTAGVSGVAVTLDPVGNVYASGTTGRGDYDMDPGSGTFTLTNGNLGGNANSYIAKLNPAGGFVWAVQFANDPNAGAGVWTANLAVDAAQNVYVTGVFTGRVDFDTGPTTTYTSPVDTNASGDGYAAKLAADGSLAYLVRIGAVNTREDGYGIAVDAAGNAYVTGQLSANTTVRTPAGDTNLTSAGTWDVYLLKLDPAGGLAWSWWTGSAGFDDGDEVVYDGAGNLYLTGIYSAATVDFDPGPGVQTLPYPGASYSVFALKLKTDGTFVNAWGFGGTEYQYAYDLALTSTGQVAVVGRFNSTVDFDPGPDVQNLTSAGDSDAFVQILAQGPINQPPVAANGTLNTPQDTPATGTLVATDTENDPLTFSLVGTTAAHGTVTITDPATGAYSYVPTAGFSGAASFTFKANDTQNDSNVATVSITVGPANDAPVAADGGNSTAEDTPLSGSVLVTDADGDTLTYSVVAGPTRGTLTAFNPSTGDFTYTPAHDYNGPDAFTFKANDGTVDSNTATFTITVDPANDPPAPADDLANVTRDGGAQPIDALANDSTAPDAGETLTVTGVTQGAHGAVAVTSGGTGLSYSPAAGYVGADSFRYTVSDGNGGTATAVVSVAVLPPAGGGGGSGPPTAVVDDAATVEDAGPLTVDVLANDSTAPDTGESLTITSVTPPAHGTATVAADGLSASYTPGPDFAGTDTFYYTVSDGHGGLASAPVVVTVANDAADRLEVVPSPGAVDFREQRDMSLPLDTALQVGTAAGGLVTKAVVKFTNGYVKGRDALTFAAQGGIRGKFSPASGALTLTGKAGPDAYEAALRAGAYRNVSRDPVGGPRTVSITLYDAAGGGGPGYWQVHVTAVDDAPKVTMPATAVVARLGKPAAVLAGLMVADPDGAFLAGATVTIGNAQAGDTLNAVTAGTGLTATFSGGVLTISGTARLATYFKVLKSVTLIAAGGAGTLRTLSLTVSDGNLDSDTATRLVTVG